MPTQREMLEVLGLGDLQAPEPKRRSRSASAERSTDPDELRWPRSLNEPLSPRQAKLWRAALEELCDVLLGDYRGPRTSSVERGWPSLLAALLTYLARRRAEQSASALGRQLDSMEHGTVGCGSGGNGTESALVRAMSANAIERAFLEAWRPRVVDYEHRHGLRFELCIELLCEAVCGVDEITRRSYRRAVTARELAARHGLAEHAVRAVVEHGRRVVVVELAARELLPLPKPRSGLLAAIRDRAEALRRDGE